jgi:nucleotide-binding universal stress UspA family protein
MKFLVPTDFSDYAKDALIYAIEMSKVFGGSITLLNVFPYTNISPYVYDELIKSITGEIKSRTINKLKNEWNINSKGILNEDSDIEIDYKAVEGGVVDNIIEIAKKDKTSLIVMGTKGAGTIKRFLFGSTTAKVIEKAPCPVLTIPKLAKYKKISKILFATGCNKNELESIQDTIKMARAYNAQVHLVYITDDSKEDGKSKLDKLKLLVESNSPYEKLHFELIQSSDVVDALNVYIQIKKINVLALATKKRTIFNKLFDKGLTKEMAFHLRVPLLAYHR